MASEFGVRLDVLGGLRKTVLAGGGGEFDGQRRVRDGVLELALEAVADPADDGAGLGHPAAAGGGVGVRVEGVGEVIDSGVVRQVLAGLAEGRYVEREVGVGVGEQVEVHPRGEDGVGVGVDVVVGRERLGDGGVVVAVVEAPDDGHERVGREGGLEGVLLAHALDDCGHALVDGRVVGVGEQPPVVGLGLGDRPLPGYVHEDVPEFLRLFIHRDRETGRRRA